MNKKKELAKNTGILFIGKLSIYLISFLLLPLYTYYLSPSQFGAVDLIVTYVTLLAPVFTVQMEMASFRFLIDARGDENRKRQVISSALRIAFLAVAMSVFVLFIIDIIFNINYFWLIVLNILAAATINIFMQFARGLGDNKKFAIASSISGLAMVIGALIFIVILKMSALGMLISIAVANLVASLYLFFAVHLYRFINLFINDKKLTKDLIKYSLPLIPNGISWWVISVSDRTIVSIFVGVAANGIYAVANKYAAIFSSVFSIFNLSWTESVSLHIDSDDRDAFLSDTINASVKIFGGLGLMLIAYIPLVFNLLVSYDFNEAYLYIPILIVAAFLNMLVGLYSAIYIAKKLTKQVANTSIFAAVINILINLALIKFIGIYAAAISTLLAYLIMSIYRHYDVKKYVKIKYSKTVFAQLIAIGFLVICLYYLNNLFGNIISAILVTVFVLWQNKSMIQLLKSKILNAEK